MSPRPHELGLRTKKSPLPRTGVGQNSSAALLRSAPGSSFTLTGFPHASSVLARCATHRSRPALPGRFDAMYRFSPSGDWIGHPSCAAVFTPLASTWSTSVAVPQFENCGPAHATTAVIAAATTASADTTACLPNIAPPPLLPRHTDA